MSNEKNLKSIGDLTTEKQREITSKGGKASVEARRKRKLFREAIKEALEVQTEEGKTVQEIGITELLNKYMKGDLKAFEIIRDTIGEKPSDKMQFEQTKPFEVNIIVKKDKK